MCNCTQALHHRGGRVILLADKKTIRSTNSNLLHCIDLVKKLSRLMYGMETYADSQ